MPTPAVSVSRAMLRDSINRLRSIRTRCGKEDEAEKERQSTGDPFRDRTQEFSANLRECKEQISERNEGARKNGQDRTTIEQSQDINRSMMQLKKELVEIKALVNDAEQKLAKENRKGKKAKSSKIVLLERQWRDREAMYNNCVEMYESVKLMDAQRFGGGDKKSGLTKAQEIKLGKQAQLRSQLLASTGRGAAYEMTPVGPGADGKEANLRENPETAAQMKILDEQERKINAGLDRLGKGVERLHNLALEIGSEIDTQNTMLDNTDNVVSSQTKQLKNLNRRLKKLVKETKPFNMFLNVGCFMLILALVGYFLYEFGVV